jgi:NAD(P)-dependent dehydrogenase (short-subunit alcohol dehydrogenase family)
MPDSSSSQRMAGQVCIVTGAASGIGRAIARTLAAQGATVVVADVTTEVIEGGAPTAEADRSRRWPGHLHPDRRGAHRAGRCAGGRDRRALRPLDVLVNNACIRHARPCSRTRGGRLAARARRQPGRRLPLLPRGGAPDGARRRRWTRCAGASSTCRRSTASSPRPATWPTAPARPAPPTSRARWRPTTPRSRSSATRSRPARSRPAPAAARIDPAVMDRAERRTPWPRLGRPDDVARAVLFLASSDASFMTGAS